MRQFFSFVFFFFLFDFRRNQNNIYKYKKKKKTVEKVDSTLDMIAHAEMFEVALSPTITDKSLNHNLCLQKRKFELKRYNKERL